MAKFLFIDGGGVFGIGPAMTLSRARGLERLSGVGGSSIGSALAAQVSVGQTPSSDFFNKWMPKIFGHKRFGSPLLWTKYSDKGINEALMTNFSGLLLCDCKIPFFCTAVDMANRNLKVFSSKSDVDASYPLWEAVRASCSPPTYLPSWRGFADGGLMANCPVVVGCSWAKMVLGYKFEDQEVFSIGCGDVPNSMGQPSDRLFSVGPWLIESMLSGASDRMQDYIARSLPLKSYRRVNFTLRPNWKMDSLASMRKAQSVLASQAIGFGNDLNAFLDA